MSNRLLFIDTETGGIDPNKHSLLSIGVVVWDAADGECYSDEFLLRSEHYSVTETAKKMNGFDMQEHNKKALSAKTIIEKLNDIKMGYFNDYLSIPLAGHNTQFDIQFIKRMYRDSRRSYEKTFSHRVVDTYSVLKYLADCNMLDSNISSSAKAFQFFNIHVDGRHTALGDARATMQLYEKLVQLNSQNK